MRSDTAKPAPQMLVVRSSAFRHGQPIPRRFTCQGEDRSPPLDVTGYPEGTRALAVIVDDPDAPRGTWTHWTAWDFKPQPIPEGFDVAAAGGREGTTSAGTVGYHGPCPPDGMHRYIVQLYALRAPLGLAEGASVKAVREAVRDAAIAQGELMGTYEKTGASP